MANLVDWQSATIKWQDEYVLEVRHFLRRRALRIFLDRAQGLASANDWAGPVYFSGSEFIPGTQREPEGQFGLLRVTGALLDSDGTRLRDSIDELADEVNQQVEEMIRDEQPRARQLLDALKAGEGAPPN